MSSNNHPGSRPGLPVSYSQNSMASNGLPFSQSQMGSFNGSVNASHSVASTPRGTPPPKGSQQSSMPFIPNGLHSTSRNSFGGFEDSTRYGAMMPNKENFKPQIYKVGNSNGFEVTNPLPGCLFQRLGL